MFSAMLTITGLFIFIGWFYFPFVEITLFGTYSSPRELHSVIFYIYLIPSFAYFLFKFVILKKQYEKGYEIIDLVLSLITGLVFDIHYYLILKDVHKYWAEPYKKYLYFPKGIVIAVLFFIIYYILISGILEKYIAKWIYKLNIIRLENFVKKIKEEDIEPIVTSYFPITISGPYSIKQLYEKIEELYKETKNITYLKYYGDKFSITKTEYKRKGKIFKNYRLPLYYSYSESRGEDSSSREEKYSIIRYREKYYIEYQREDNWW